MGHEGSRIVSVARAHWQLEVREGCWRSTCFEVVLCAWREGEKGFRVPVDRSQQACFSLQSRRTDRWEEVLTDNVEKVNCHD